MASVRQMAERVLENTTALLHFDQADASGAANKERAVCQRRFDVISFVDKIKAPAWKAIGN